MAVTFANLGVNANPDFISSTNSLTYNTGSWTPPTEGLILVWVSSAIFLTSTNPAVVPTIQGNSLTWRLVGTVILPTLPGARLSLFFADAGGSTTGITSVGFGTQTQDACVVSFAHVIGDATPVIVAVVTGFGTGTSASILLPSAFTSDSRPVAGFALSSSTQALSPRVNWTEWDDLFNITFIPSLETQYRADAFDTEASASWGFNSSWTGIAAEVTDVPEAPPPPQLVLIATAEETDTAVALGLGLDVLQSQETDTALVLAVETTISVVVGLVAETDEALVIVPLQVNVVTLVEETDIALPIAIETTITIAVATAEETDEALFIGYTQELEITRAIETDEALLIPVATDQTIVVTLVEETDEALVVPTGIRLEVGLATETNESFALSSNQSYDLGVTLETNVALGIIVDRTINISTAEETDFSFPILFLSAYPDITPTGIIKLVYQEDVSIMMKE